MLIFHGNSHFSRRFAFSWSLTRSRSRPVSKGCANCHSWGATNIFERCAELALTPALQVPPASLGAVPRTPSVVPSGIAILFQLALLHSHTTVWRRGL